MGFADDPRLLNIAIQEILKSEGGHQALLEALTHLGYAERFLGKEVVARKIIEALLAEREAGVLQLSVCLPVHIIALATAADALDIAAAMLLENTTTGGLETCKLLGSEAFALKVLTGTFAVPPGKDATETAPVANACIAILAHCAAHGDYELNGAIIAADAANAAITALEEPVRAADESFVSNAFYLIDALATLHGITEIGLTKTALRTVHELLRQHGTSEYIQATGGALWQKLADAFAGCKEALLEDRMRGIVAVYEPARNWQEVIAAADQVYYFDQTNSESAWEMPPAYAAFATELDAIDEVRSRR